MHTARTINVTASPLTACRTCRTKSAGAGGTAGQDFRAPEARWQRRVAAAGRAAAVPQAARAATAGVVRAAWGTELHPDLAADQAAALGVTRHVLPCSQPSRHQVAQLLCLHHGGPDGQHHPAACCCWHWHDACLVWQMCQLWDVPAPAPRGGEVTQWLAASSGPHDWLQRHPMQRHRTAPVVTTAWSTHHAGAASPNVMLLSAGVQLVTTRSPRTLYMLRSCGKAKVASTLAGVCCLAQARRCAEDVRELQGRRQQLSMKRRQAVCGPRTRLSVAACMASSHIHT